MKFSPLQLTIVFTLFIGISGDFVILPHLLLFAKRDSWVCSIIAYFILLIWGALIYWISLRMKNQKLYDWMKERAGIAASTFIILLFALYVIFIGMSALYELILCIKVYILQKTPIWVTTICFLIICLRATRGGFKTIVQMSIIFFPIIIFLGLFVVLTSIPVNDYSFLFPVLIHGSHPVISGTAMVLSGNADLIILFMLQHHLKESYSLSHLILLITLLLIMVLGPAVGAIASFGPNMASVLRFPVFEQWRLATLGHYLTHLDFMALFQLITGSFIKVALSLYVLIDLLEPKSTKLKKLNNFIYPLIFVSIIFVPSDYIVQSSLDKIVYPYLFLYVLIISIVLVIVSYLPIRKGISSV